MLQVDTLVIDRWPRIGDNWRQRYHALTLHNQVHVNHLPYMPFPPGWPTYIAKDKLAGWFEAYVESMEINFWPQRSWWAAPTTRRKAAGPSCCATPTARHAQMHPRHVVLATGVSGIPSVPDIPGLKTSPARCMHSSQYDDGENWTGKRAIVVGTGNSGHDIAQDLHSSGAEVTLVQRSPTLIVNIEPSAQLPYALYDEGPPLEDCDLIADVDAAAAGAEEPHRPDREGARSSTRRCSTGWSASASGSTSARTTPAGSSNTSPAAAATISTSAAPT